MIEILAAIDAPHFNAAIVLWNDRVEETAPILRYMRGWSRDRVRAYCQEKSWTIEVVHRLERSDPRTQKSPAGSERDQRG